MRAEASELDRLLAGIRGCRNCVETPSGKPLPHEPRPVLRVSHTARLAVCSQAPGTRVHASGTPFTDPSGDRLRGLDGGKSGGVLRRSRDRHRPHGVLLSPASTAMAATCRRGAKCAGVAAPLFAALPGLRLLLAVGSYAHAWHLGPEWRGASLTETVAAWREIAGTTRDPMISRSRTPPGATMAGSRRTRGSRRSCFPLRREAAIARELALTRASAKNDTQKKIPKVRRT